MVARPSGLAAGSVGALASSCRPNLSGPVSDLGVPPMIVWPRASPFLLIDAD
jgi:hypothetical protein